MGAPAASSVVRVLSLGIVIDGFGLAPDGLLQRQFRLGRKVIAVQAGTWSNASITLALAWSGHGAMSLAIGRVVGSLVYVGLMLVFAPEGLRLGFDRSKARQLLRFGIPLAGSNLLAFVVGSADQLVVGHMLGPIALGYFVLASNLSSWPINVFSQSVSSVAPAIFARLQNEHCRMRETFLSIVGMLGAVALPISLVIGGAATPLIGFMYGSVWLPATRAVLWLALLGAMKIFFLVIYDYLVVLARSRCLLLVQVVWLIALIPALFAGAYADGIFGLALAEAAVAAFVVLPCYMAGMRKESVQCASFLRHLWAPVLGALAAGVVAAVMAPSRA